MAPSLSVVLATAEHAEELAPRLHPSDVALAQEAGRTALEAILYGIEQTPTPYALLFDGLAMGIWGVVPSSGHRGHVWFAPAEELFGRWRFVARASRSELERLLSIWPVLVACIGPDNPTLIRWLRWLGGEVSPAAPVGPGGALRHSITFRRTS